MELRTKTLLGGALCLCLGSCVRVQWSRTELCRPAEVGVLEGLRVGQSNLSACLAELGAPLFVWETAEDEYALAYGWDKDSGWGINVSVPLGQEFSATFDFEDLNRKLHGIVLTFDGEDLLLRKRRGYLSEIAEDAQRRRPALVEPHEVSESEGN